ncbi:MAG: DNA primase [Oscillospiraceae bacterium]|nr:DNA primase [Oscillospiraceae bacterium]
MPKYEKIIAAVTPRQAAKRYGRCAGRSSMMHCPFHIDDLPSLKLYDDHYYCFGCQATGDVVDLTAKLLSISSEETVKKLTDDFDLDETRVSVFEETPSIATQADDMEFCEQVLRDYLEILDEWEVRYAPSTSDEEPHERYAEAITMIVCVEYMLYQMEFGTEEEC